MSEDERSIEDGKKWASLGEIGDVIADRVVECLASREVSVTLGHPVVTPPVRLGSALDDEQLHRERRAHAAAREQIAAYERALADARAQRDGAIEARDAARAELREVYAVLGRGTVERMAAEGAT